MSLYETVWITRQDLTQAQVTSLAEEFTALIKAQGGEVKKQEYWGLRNLAYKIKKNRKGHYTLFNIEAPASAITELERVMRINEDILRYMSVRVEEMEEGPSAVLRQKDRQDEDGDDGHPRRRPPRSGGYEGREGREGRESRVRQEETAEKETAS